MSLERRENTALDSLLREFASCAVAPTRRLIATYVRGQLSGLPRKSVMPIARDAGIAPRTLQELLSLHRWDEGRLRDLLQRRVARILSGRPSRAVALDVSYPKKGRMTPGVDRQTRPESGRAANCVRAVHLVVVDGTAGCLLDSAVFLPESWTRRPDRLRRAGMSINVEFRTAGDLAGELMERAKSIGIAGDPWSGEGMCELSPGRLGRVRPGGAPLQAAEAVAVREEIVLRGAAWRVGGVSFQPEGESAAGRLLGFQQAGLGAPRYFLFPESGEGAAGLLESVLVRDEARAAFERLRQRLGLGHFEVRSFQSLRRHFLLSSIGSLFLFEEAMASGAPTRGVAL